VVDELPRGAALKVDRRRLITMLEDLGVNVESLATPT
jgi:long-chain acyl-CoA synthetase